MISSTRHHLNDLNLSKRFIYNRFLNEYSRVALEMVDQIWNNLLEDLNTPKYIDYKSFKIETNLSARAMSSAAEQSLGIVRGAIEKQRRRLWVKKNKNPNARDILFSKPTLSFVFPNIATKCCDFEFSTGKFLGFLRLKCLGKEYGSIKIPIIRHPRVKGQIKNGFILKKDSIQIAWEIKKNSHAQGDRVVGIDQGLKVVATLSDGQTTPESCPHGHSLDSILDKLSRKKKGSKSFARTQIHRKNFVNWSINQLNFSDLREVRLEKVVNIRKGIRSSRKMSHWSNPEIRDKIKRRCEELEVPVVEQSCAYRSQRCSNCGLVRKANRKAKIYECKSCGFVSDADLNAAKNHEADLEPIPFSFIGQKLNLGKGFYWNPEGLSSIDGSELRVPNNLICKR